MFIMMEKREKWVETFLLLIIIIFFFWPCHQTLHICRCSDILFSEIPIIKRSSNSPSLTLWASDFSFSLEIWYTPSVYMLMRNAHTHGCLADGCSLKVFSLLDKSSFEHHQMTFSHSASQHLLQRACYETPVYQTRSMKMAHRTVFRQVTV